MLTQKQHPIEIKDLFNAHKRVAPYPPGGVVPGRRIEVRKTIGVKKMIDGTAFFPGGSGLWNTPLKKALPCSLQDFYDFFVNSEPPTMPIGKVMVLGNYFDTKAGYEESFENRGENLNCNTWRYLLEYLHRIDLRPKDCFFTNAYMGLKVGLCKEDSNMDECPGAYDEGFRERCRLFLAKQIAIQTPSLILTLGRFVPRLLAPLSPKLAELDAWKKWQNFKKLDADKVPLVDNVRFKDSEKQPVVVVALVHPAGRNMGNTLKNRHYCEEKGKDAELAMLKDALKQSGLY